MSTFRSCARTVVKIQRTSSVIYTGERGIKRWVAPTLRELRKRKEKMGPQAEPHRSNFLEWNYNAEIFAFNRRLSEDFDTNLLQQALTHRSYVIQEEDKQRAVGILEPKLDIQDNSQLIEEGKELTSKVVTLYLGQALPRLPEEGIVAVHDYLLSEEVLARVSSHIGTKDIILCGEHPVQSDTLANTFLALVSALSRSVDSEHAGIFVRDFLIATLAEKDLTSLWAPVEPLKILDQILVREKQGPAEPRLVAQAGVNTILATYQVAVYSDKQFLGVGTGESVDVAKDMAALDALRRLFGITDFSRPIPFDLKVDFSSNQTMENLPLTRWCTENLKNMVQV